MRTNTGRAVGNAIGVSDIRVVNYGQRRSVFTWLYIIVSVLLRSEPFCCGVLVGKDLQSYFAVRLDNQTRDVELLSFLSRPAFSCRGHNCTLDKIVGCAGYAGWDGGVESYRICTGVAVTLEPFATGAVSCRIDDCVSVYATVSLEFKSGALNVAYNRTEVKL